MTSEFELSDDTPVYVISVAAQLSGLHPQTLRAYDRLGLVSPGRAAGRGRRYSLRDILILRQVQRLSQEEGINLSGIKRILELELAERRSRTLLAEMHAEISQLRNELESTRAVAARLATLVRGQADGGALVPVRDGGSGRPRPATAVPQPSAGASQGQAGEGQASADQQSKAQASKTQPAGAAAAGSGAHPGADSQLPTAAKSADSG
jgi:MerR family transcriptional regulator, heat shock protein HspR